MFPEIVKIGPFVIRSFGLLVAIAFLVSYKYTVIRAKGINISENFINNCLIYILIFGIVGARVLYVLLNLSFYKGRFLEVFKVWEGGLIFHGGFAFSLFFLILYLKKNKINILKFLDITVPALVLGIAIGRIGCFLAGCCYGKMTELPWGVVFNHPASLAPQGVKLHPTQIYESLFNFLLFLLLNNIKKRFDGEIFCIGIFFTSTFRFINEFIRGDERGILIFGFYFSQYFSLFLILFSLIYFFVLWRKHFLLKKGAIG